MKSATYFISLTFFDSLMTCSSRKRIESNLKARKIEPFY